MKQQFGKRFLRRFFSMILAFFIGFGSIPVDIFATEMVEKPFTVTVGEQEMRNVQESTLSWTDWSGGSSEITCYTVMIPRDAQEATLTFEEEKQWSYYDSTGNYIGEGNSSWTAATEHTVGIQDLNGDEELDGISIQIPNDFSTEFFILFVYEEVETSCIDILEDAPVTAKVSAGGLYKLNLNTIFSDTEGHGVEYSYKIQPSVENEHTKISNDEFCFTSQEKGDYIVTFTSKCNGNITKEHRMTITVKDANQGIDAQYGYEETEKSSVTVFVNLSNDGMVLLGNDYEETPLANLEVTVPYFELELYDLEQYNRYGTENGKGPYVNHTIVKRPTVLHLYLYLLERYYMGLPEAQCGRGTSGVLEYAKENDISYLTGDLAFSSDGKSALKYSGGATSIFMNEFWGHDCNLMYYRNHCYPYMSSGWGATSDYMLLSDGDVIDVAMFTDWGFYHTGYFASFEEDCYEVEEGGSRLTVKTRQWRTTAETENFVDVNGSEGLSVTLYNGDWEELEQLSYDQENRNEITFTVPKEDGTYYLMATDPDATNQEAKIAPAVARVLVGNVGTSGEAGDANNTAVRSIYLNTYQETLIWNKDEHKTLLLTPSVIPAEATGWTIQWKSSDESIASVDQSGLVTGLKEGTATITASIGDIKAECVITVERYNTAPVIVEGAKSHEKLKVMESHTVNVADLFQDEQKDTLTYTAVLYKASGLTSSWEYKYETEVQNIEVIQGKCTVTPTEAGIFALKITASDGTLTKTHIYQLTVVKNDAGKISLNDGVVFDFYNVVVVGATEEFVEDFEIPYKGTHDTTIHHIVLSKDTVSGTPPRKVDITLQEGYQWGQYSGSGKDSSFQTRADIGVFAYDPVNGTSTAHYLKFHTECVNHTDEDDNNICDSCTMKLGKSGQFVLMAMNQNGFVIEPCYVSYEAGATLKEALKGSRYTFEGIDSGFVSAIEGDINSYSFYYDHGGYSFDTPAEDISVVYFTANTSQDYQEDLLNLTLQMGKYITSTNGVKNYGKAKTAYETAATEFYHTKNASKLYQDLKNAMEKYEVYVNGEPITVPMTITMNSQRITSGKAVFYSEFETSPEEFSDWSHGILLKPGSYTFDISDGEFRHVRGTIEVKEGAALTATLPTGTWLHSLDLSIQYGDNWKAVEKANVTGGTATYKIPDYSSTSLYPYAVCNEDSSQYKLFKVGGTSANIWKSHSTALAHVIEANSLKGETIGMEIRLVENPDDYEQYQTFTMEIQRIPSLETLTVSENKTTLKLDFDKNVKEYTVLTASDSVNITATPLSSEGKITVDGMEADSTESVNVTLSEDKKIDNGSYEIPVTVTASNGLTTTYTIYVVKTDAVQVLLETPNPDVSLVLFNDAGAVVEPVSIDGIRYTYQVISDVEYTYIVTANDVYHTTSKLKVTSPQTISLPTPKTQENWLHTLGLKSGSDSQKNAPVYQLIPEFHTNQHNYETTVESNTAAFYLKAFSKDTENYKTEAIFKAHDNTQYGHREEQKEISNTKYNKLNQFLGTGGWGNDLLLRVTQKEVEDGVTYYQDYHIRVNRKMTLYNLSVKDENGESLILTQKEKETTGFEKQKYEYTTSVSATTEKMTLSLKAINTSTAHDYNQYEIMVKCGAFEKIVTYTEESQVVKEQTVEVPLNGKEEAEEIKIMVSHKGQGVLGGVYTITCEKLPTISTQIITDPMDATVFLTEELSGSRIYPELDGTFELMSGKKYKSVVTKYGYVSQAETFVAGSSNAVISVNLTKAPENTLQDLATDGDWLQFRADNKNNGVVDAKTPIQAEDAVLEWSHKIGEGFDSGATGCPIIVGGYLYTYAGNSIVKVNKDTGEIVDSGVMVASSSFAINSPTYAEGMIFVGLSDGRVQAFNAETLDSLWVFSDDLGGQPNCPIVYHDGYIYTGFWNSEVSSANFVCISITDEDPTISTEIKVPTWTYTHHGFYWAGAYVNDDFVLVGTDDGDSGYTKGFASILSFDPKTGMMLDEEKLPTVGDQRSSICYDESTDAYYFTTKGGYFYQILVEDNGEFVENSLYGLYLDPDANRENNPPMSTSTPVIYNGRAYVGVSGTSQFGAYSGHNMTVIDLDTFSIAYRVPTQGYPQVSGLLSTAYEEDGYVYIYFIDNYTPGKIRVIRDNPSMTTVDSTYTSTETYTKAGKTETIETGYVLFTPNGSEAQYAICSPIADAEGNLYFKNDSARLMKLSSRMTHLEIAQQPEKTQYEVGNTFDSTGMKVLAHYANGIVKDITKYVSYTSSPLTVNDTEITVSFAPDKMFVKGDTSEGGFFRWYQDFEGTVGTKYNLPTATVTIDIHKHQCSKVPETMQENDVDIQKPSVEDNSETNTNNGTNTNDGSNTNSATGDTTVKSSDTITDISAKLIGYDDVKITWKKAKGATGYLVSYKKASAKKWSKPVTVTKKTAYTKKNLADGVEYTFKVVPYYQLSSDTKKYYEEKQSKTVSIYTLKKVSKLKLKKKGFKVKVQWKNINGETGYQISQSTSKKKTKIVATCKTATKNFKKIPVKKGKKYYYKVRAYKVENGKKIYGPWSRVKSQIQ